MLSELAGVLNRLLLHGFGCGGFRLDLVLCRGRGDAGCGFAIGNPPLLSPHNMLLLAIQQPSPMPRVGPRLNSLPSSFNISG